MITRNIRELSWELTSKCNLNCKHCYNAVPMNRGTDLSIEEQLDICDQIIDTDIRSVQLTGGEILMAQGWAEVATKLIDGGIRVGIITNGLLLNEQKIQEISQIGISSIGLSVEGLQYNNDMVRGANTFIQIMKAIELLFEINPKLPISVNTTINRCNINDLKLLAAELYKRHVSSWMVQLAVPDGNFKEHKNNFMVHPSQIDDIIDIIYEIWKSVPMNVFLGDCIGHFNAKEIEIRSIYSKSLGLKSYTEGCGAGIYTVGIKSNGDVVGCISLNDKRYVEGNLKNLKLKEIIESPISFAWNQEIKSKKQLAGDCTKCQFGDICKSGCPSLKYDKNHQLIENIYCSYNYAIKRERQRISSISDIEVLKSEYKIVQEEDNIQILDLYRSRIDYLYKCKN